jgi:histidine triad (HIT) family protein
VRQAAVAVTLCVFCAIVAGDAPATVVHRWPDAIAIVPRGSTIEGHLLVIPAAHIAHAAQDPVVAGAVMARAAEVAVQPYNIITSAGVEATQSVFHLHLHVVPRRAGDGLSLPWTVAP